MLYQTKSVHSAYFIELAIEPMLACYKQTNKNNTCNAEHSINSHFLIMYNEKKTTILQKGIGL